MDKRSAERVPILGELQGEIMIFQPMLVVEVSRHAATVETRFPLQLDSLHDVRLALPSGAVVVKARVVHSRINEVDQEIVTYRSGMEFVDVPGRVDAALEAFLTSMRTGRSASEP
jgi:hypothetical protein